MDRQIGIPPETNWVKKASDGFDIYPRFRDVVNCMKDDISEFNNLSSIGRKFSDGKLCFNEDVHLFIVYYGDYKGDRIDEIDLVKMKVGERNVLVSYHTKDGEYCSYINNEWNDENLCYELTYEDCKKKPLLPWEVSYHILSPVMFGP